MSVDSRLSGIYAVLDAGVTPDCEALLAALVPAGIGVFQYRAKAGVDLPLLRRLVRRTRAAGALLLVNDDPDAAREADGLHIGQEDLIRLGAPVVLEAATCGLLGVSADSPAEAAEAERLGAAYVGVGPFAGTETKSDAGDAIGSAGIARVARSTVLPVAAIGGIREEHVRELVRSGARMIAVVSALARAEHPERAARRLRQAFATAVS